MLRGKYKKATRKKDSFLCSKVIIITTKEARKLLGEEISDRVSDEEPARLIGLMHRLANDLIDSRIISKHNVAVQ